MRKCVTCAKRQARYQYKSTQFDPVTDFQAQRNLHGIGQKTFNYQMDSDARP